MSLILGKTVSIYVDHTQKKRNINPSHYLHKIKHSHSKN